MLFLRPYRIRRHYTPPLGNWKTEMERKLSNARGMFGGLFLLVAMLILAGCEPAEDPKAAESANPTAMNDSQTAPAVAPTPETEKQPAPTGEMAAPASKDAPSESSQGDQESAAKPEGDDPKKTTAKTLPTRQTTEGWWRILFSLPSNEDELVHDFSAGFVKIGKADDGYAVEELRANQIISPAELTEKSTATDQSVQLFFQYEDLRFNYAGKLQQGRILGNLQFEQPRQNIVRLVPVAEEFVTDETLEETDLGPTQDAAAIAKAAAGDDPVAALTAGGEKWASSPASFFAWQSVVGGLVADKLEAAGVKPAVEGYLAAAKPWGERAVGLAKINAATALMATGTELDYAETLLAESKKSSPELTEIWSEQIAAAQEMAAVAAAWQEVKSGDAEKGLKKLRELHTASPSSELISYRLASAEQEHGSKEQAERLFASLAVSPRMFSQLASIATEKGFVEPEEAAAALYKERTGSAKGLDSYLLSVYRDTVTSFVPDEEKSREATKSERVVLLELFTGASCPPCVAADIGTEAIEKSFPHEDVVVLRYHLHIPGPDPLATNATEARQEYYASDIRGTPTVLVNGTQAPFPVGGMYGRSELVYRSLAGMLTTLVMEPTPAEVNLSATVEGDKLHIVAKGSTKEKAFDTVKLRIVIAENEIDFPAPNGILEHSMVVRGMPGGAEGIASKNGEFTFDETISLTELRDQMNDYLDAFETRRGPVFPSRPGSLKRISVVAFLQDDVTHEILQAALVPIEQDIVLPPPGASEKKEESKKEEE